MCRSEEGRGGEGRGGEGRGGEGEEGRGGRGRGWSGVHCMVYTYVCNCVVAQSCLLAQFK